MKTSALTALTLCVALLLSSPTLTYADGCADYGAQTWGEVCGNVPNAGCCDPEGRLLWCESGELCMLDCATLAPQCGWNADVNYYDCKTEGAEDPSGEHPLACGPCEPQCGTKECGPDGCGGSCGACGEGEACTDGACIPCAPQCAGKECGPDGCGGECGDCGPDGTCTEEFKCEVCERYCDGKVCGDDGCGGSCGLCPSGYLCQDGACVGGDCGDITFNGCCAGRDKTLFCANEELRVLDCKEMDPAYECGWNGFKYTCGLPDMLEMDGDPSGELEMVCEGYCMGDCEGKVCGDDGCGGSCGLCEAGLACDDGQCAEAPDDPDVQEETSVDPDAGGDAPAADGQGGEDAGGGLGRDTGGGGGCAWPRSGQGAQVAWLLLFASLLLVTRARWRRV